MRETSASDNRLCSSSIRFERFIDSTIRSQAVSAATTTTTHWRSKSAPNADDSFPENWDSSSKPVKEDNEDIRSSPVVTDTKLKSRKDQRICLEQDVKRLRSRLKGQKAAKDILQQALARPSSVLIPSDCNYISQKTERLIRDIALLELEVVQLEQHLLSLYRKAFDVKIKDQSCVSKVLNAEELSQFNYAQSCLLETPVAAKKYLTGKLSSKSGVLIAGKSIGDRTFVEQIPTGIQSTTRKAMSSSSYSQPIIHCSTAKKEATKGSPSSLMTELWREVTSAEANTSSGLSDEWPLVRNVENPNKLSEELVRYMAAIYCRLADPPISHAGSAISPTSSTTSASTFSSKEFLSEGWSPHWKTESPCTPLDTDLQQRRNLGNSSPHASVVAVHWINIDNDRLHYAEKMMHHFRDMVRQLERVDPSKLGHEEKLAFWINVYNALMMHAYLAYGIPKNHVKRASLLHKASYKIGTYSINAFTIENSLLGCKHHRRAQWIQSLFSPVSKLIGAYRQGYALEKPEPLVCFAICCGGRSDPLLRVYTAKNVHRELDVARRDFLQANVMIREGKILVPRILESFVRESSMGSLGLIEWVSQNVSESKRRELKAVVVKTKPCKCIEWVPYNFNFRYLFIRDIVRRDTSSLAHR